MTKKEIMRIDFYSVQVPYISLMTRKMRIQGYTARTIGEFLNIPAAELLKAGVGHKTLLKVQAYLKNQYGLHYEVPPPKPTTETIINNWQAAFDASDEVRPHARGA